jgi:AraC-like DNA-binding protein
VVYRRTAQLIRNDDVMFSFGAAEGAFARQRDREAAAKQGDALLMLGAECAVVGRAKEGRINCLRLPRTALAGSVPNLEDSFCRRIPGDLPSLALLTGYLRVLAGGEEMGTPDLQQLAVTHILDLIGITLGATREAADVADRRGVRAARFRSIKDSIADDPGGEDWSIGLVAARHRVAPRYVQRLFEEAGTTFTEFLLAQRLACAHRLLGDPNCAGQTVTAIALKVGFGDLSYFNRTFRRRYGAAPSDVRAQARVVN